MKSSYLCRMLRWSVVIVVTLQLSLSGCSAAWSNGTSLSSCDYPSEDQYVANATQMQVPAVGYLECANATGSDGDLCSTCECREKKTASVGGVTVAWVVCVEARDEATCLSSVPGREYCISGSTSSGTAGSAAGGSSSGSSSGESFSVDAGDSLSGSNVSNGSNVMDAGVHVTSNLNSGSTSTSNDSSLTTDPSASKTAASSSVESISLSPPSEAENEDNVITGVVGTVEPSPTTAATSTGENIIRPSDSKSADKLDTNNGSPNDSSWSSQRLTVVASVMCGIAAVAAVAVFVAVRNDRAKKRKLPGTPADDFTDDDSALATPTTERFDGVYRHNNHGRRDNGYYGGGGSKRMTDSSDNLPLASIVVIGPGDEFNLPASYASGRPSQPYAGARRKASRSASRRHPSNSKSIGTTSSGPLMSEGAFSQPDPALDTMHTNVSFSSSTSSVNSACAPSERMYDSESSSNLNESFRLVSATFSESVEGPDTNTSSRGAPAFRTTNFEPTSTNTIVSFESSLSSLSSLDSSQYDVRDTEASEHMHDSEDGMMYTNSSRMAVPFDASSVSTEL